MIQIQDVSFEYEKEQGTLSHINLNIPQGECIVLTGESGCGKTTVDSLKWVFLQILQHRTPAGWNTLSVRKAS